MTYITPPQTPKTLSIAQAAWIAAAIERSKREITADVKSGRVPRDIDDFSRLHDFVDANEYGIV